MANNSSSKKIYNKPKSPFLGWRKLKSRKGKENKKPKIDKQCKKIEGSESIKGKEGGLETISGSKVQDIGDPNLSCLDVYERLSPSMVNGALKIACTKPLYYGEITSTPMNYGENLYIKINGEKWTPFLNLPQLEALTLKNEKSDKENNDKHNETEILKCMVPSEKNGTEVEIDSCEVLKYNTVNNEKTETKAKLQSIKCGKEIDSETKNEVDYKEHFEIDSDSEEFWKTECEEEDIGKEGCISRLKSVLKKENAQNNTKGNAITVLGLGFDQYLKEVYGHLGDRVSLGDTQALCRILGLKDTKIGKDTCICPPNLYIDSVKENIGCPAHLTFSEFRQILSEASGTEIFPREASDVFPPKHRAENPRLVQAVVSVSRRTEALDNIGMMLESVNDVEKQMILKEQEVMCLREVIEDLRLALQNSDAENLALRVKLSRDDDLCLTDEEDDLESLLQRLPQDTTLQDTTPEDTTPPPQDTTHVCTDDDLEQQLAVAHESLAASEEQQEAVSADLRAAVIQLQKREAEIERATSHSAILARQAATARSALVATSGRLATTCRRLSQLVEARHDVLIQVATARNLVASCLAKVRAGERALTYLAALSPHPLDTALTSDPLKIPLTPQPLDTALSPHTYTHTSPPHTPQPLDSALTSQPFNTALTSQPFNTALTSQPLDTALSPHTSPYHTPPPLNTALNSEPLDTVLTSELLDTALTPQPLDTALSPHTDTHASPSHSPQPLNTALSPKALKITLSPETLSHTTLNSGPSSEPSETALKPLYFTQQPLFITEEPLDTKQPLSIAQEPLTREPLSLTQPLSITEQPLAIQQPLSLTQPLPICTEPLLITEQPLLIPTQPLSLTQPLPISTEPLLITEQPLLITEQPLLITEQTLTSEFGFIHSEISHMTKLECSSRVDSGLYSEESERDDDISASEEDLWVPKESDQPSGNHEASSILAPPHKEEDQGGTHPHRISPPTSFTSTPHPPSSTSFPPSKSSLPSSTSLPPSKSSLPLTPLLSSTSLPYSSTSLPPFSTTVLKSTYLPPLSPPTSTSREILERLEREIAMVVESLEEAERDYI